MTSTLYFYKLPINLYDKNFILESLETYLATLTPVVKSNFQYQRFEMEKRIKVNISQDYQTYNGLTRYNYLKITELNEDNSTAIYYYFIKSAKQISESTIEFILRLDVLNTFHYYTTSATTSQNNYSISDKSLITREHKNRFKTRSNGTILQNLSEEELIYVHAAFDGGYDGDEDSPIYFIGYAGDIINYINQNGWFSMFYTQDLEDGTLNEFAIELFIGNNSYGRCAQVIFNYPQIELDDENGDDMEFIDWKNLQNSNVPIGLKFRGISDVDTINWACHSLDLDDHQYYNYFFPYNNECIINQKISRSISEVYRIIDRYQEGIESITFKVNEKQLLDSDELRQWYVAFSSSNAVVQNPNDTQPTYVNPVQVDFLSSDGYSVSTTTSHVVRITPTSVPNTPQKEEWLVFRKDQFESGGYLIINGVTYNKNDITQIWVLKKNSDDLVFRKVGTTADSTNIGTNVAYIDCYGIKSCELWVGTGSGTIFQNATYKEMFYINSGTSSDTITSDPFRAFDVTDSKLIKVIAFPYCPRYDLVGKTSFSGISSDLVINNTLKCIELQNAQNTGFDRILSFGEVSPWSVMFIDPFSVNTRKARNKIYESKLYHSDYYLPKFVYDSFTFSFMLETMDIDTIMNNPLYKQFNVRYVCSGNVQSKFMFQFNDYVCDGKEIQDYNNLLIVERNNEKALFNNAYINYIRSGGFSYDTKKASTQTLTNSLTATLSTIGSIASFVSTPVTGVKGIMGGVALAVAGASKTISTIATAQQNDRAIAQKLLALNNQSISVSSAEDIDILTAYSDNKAKLCTYKVSEQLENALWDLFHYFGYKTNEYKIPNVSTRCNFNFVQGEVILQDYTFNEEFAIEITNKWKEGITFMHWDSGTSSYDFEQQYENFEVSLFN